MFNFKGRELKRNNLLLHIVWLIICLLPIICSFLLITDGQVVAFRFHNNYEVGVPCVFKTITGYNCPSCGGTRSFVYMSRFSLLSAWNLSKAATMLYILMALQIPYRIVLIARGSVPFQRIIARLGIVFLIFIGVVDIADFVAQFI